MKIDTLMSMAAEWKRLAESIRVTLDKYEAEAPSDDRDQRLKVTRARLKRCHRQLQQLDSLILDAVREDPSPPESWSHAD